MREFDFLATRPPTGLSQRGDFLYELMLSAGACALDFYRKRKNLTISYKDSYEIFSQADVQTEALIRKDISSKYPSENLLGEEEGLTLQKQSSKTSASEAGCWVIDPIDGTNNFLMGFDYWGISVAYVEKDEILLGSVFNPVKNELFFAEKGAGSYLNGKPLRKMTEEGEGFFIKKKIMGMGLGRRFSPKFQYELLEQLKKHKVDTRTFSCCSLMLCEVAKQSLVAYYEPFINSWDCLAGCLVNQEIGAVTNDFLKENNRDGLLKGNRLLVAPKYLYDWLDEILPKLDLSNWTSEKC